MKLPLLHKAILREVEAGRVSASESGNLTLYKYTPECANDRLWNEVNRKCRGIIFGPDSELICHPFDKFFNLGEQSETQLDNLPDEPFVVYEKLDGSCGAGYFLNGEWHLATPGSMESDQAQAGTLLLKDYDLSHLPENVTPVFEIIYPENRVVLKYTWARLVLLTVFDLNARHTEWHKNRVDELAHRCDFDRPEIFEFSCLEDAVRHLENKEHFEGFVVRFEGGLRLKIKTPWYVRLHRVLNYLTPKNVIDLIRGREYGTIVRDLPHDIAKDFDDIRAWVQRVFDMGKLEISLWHERLGQEVGLTATRKEKALWIMQNVPNKLTGFVFAALDNKDYTDRLWRKIQEELKDE